MSAPLGQYDPSRLVNIGTNRWFIKPDIGISKALGALTLELSAGVFFFTDNDDYYGGKTLEQDPVFSPQAHVTYNFGRGVWGALDGTYDYGGRTTVNGVRGDDVQKNSRGGATLALPVNRSNSIKLYASTGVSTRTGSDYNLGGIAWQYRWWRWDVTSLTTICRFFLLKLPGRSPPLLDHFCPDPFPDYGPQ